MSAVGGRNGEELTVGLTKEGLTKEGLTKEGLAKEGLTKEGHSRIILVSFSRHFVSQLILC